MVKYKILDPLYPQINTLAELLDKFPKLELVVQKETPMATKYRAKIVGVCHNDGLGTATFAEGSTPELAIANYAATLANCKLEVYRPDYVHYFFVTPSTFSVE